MAKVTFQKATTAHAKLLAPLLREADVAEVWASHGVDARTALESEVLRSNCAVAMFLENEIAAVFGLVHQPKCDCMWFVTGRAVSKYPIAFMKGGKAVLAAFRCISPSLYNWVDIRYIESVRLFQHLGFKLGPPVPRGINGELFRLVEVGGVP